MKPLLGVELKRFIRDYRRSNPVFRHVAVLLQSVEYPYNVGSVFRLCDGAGVEKLYLSGITPTPPNPTIEKTARYKINNVPWEYIADPASAVDLIRANGYAVIAVEMTDMAVPYHHFQYPEKICLVVGHEDHGITKTVLSKCNASVFIPMFGKGRSHNVHTALSIVLYHALLSD